MCYIVLSHHWELRENVLWMMHEEDERFGTPDFKPVTRIVACGGNLGRIATGENGKHYRVLPDWSVVESP
jgi:hypothetical protein